MKTSYILETRNYKRKKVGQKWGKPVSISKQENYSYEKFLKYVVNASSFFKSLGGKESTRGLTQISISPNRLEKTEFNLKKE